MVPFDADVFFSPGVYTFGLFAVDIFANAGQVVTGNLAPYFMTICKPNYTALGCHRAPRYISHREACTGDRDDILHARKTFPSKEAALSTYAALYLAVSRSRQIRPSAAFSIRNKKDRCKEEKKKKVESKSKDPKSAGFLSCLQMYVTCTVRVEGSRLAKPVLSLALLCLAFLTGLNRIAEYRNHWADVIAGFVIGTAVATFLVRGLARLLFLYSAKAKQPLCPFL